jgi:glycosyltransferase involved in cell wall biosynthesis
MKQGIEKLSLVVPVYFEEECIAQFIKETTEVLITLPIVYEIIFIDDGSADNTVSIIKQHAQKNLNIKLIELSYNHGKQAAVTAGITYSTGDYVIYMDPDLQDPPVEIPRFLDEIRKGYDLVFGIRENKKDTFSNKILSSIFWSVLNRFTGLNIPRGLAVMRIFSRSFANEFIKYKEQNRFIEGIFMLIGMNRTTITIAQRERFAGKTKFNFKRKMKLAFDAIFDFSETPLKIATYLGFILFIVGLCAMIAIVFAKTFLINFQAGWPSLISAIIMSNGILLFFMGISSIYIGKTYKETKNRPLFSIKAFTNIIDE